MIAASEASRLFPEGLATYGSARLDPNAPKGGWARRSRYVGACQRQPGASSRFARAPVNLPAMAGSSPPSAPGALEPSAPTSGQADAPLPPPALKTSPVSGHSA